MYLRHLSFLIYSFFFFFNDTATTEIYTLSLHDALPIFVRVRSAQPVRALPDDGDDLEVREGALPERSEEHTSELQSRLHLVCRLLLEKKKTARQPTLIRYVARS